MSVRILIGDCRDKLRGLPDASMNCCVTSPPYFGLRDYDHEGQMGLEPTPDEFVAGMVEVFREVRRVLRDDGTLWLNIGDSYAGSGKGGNPESGKQATNKGSQSVGVLYGKTGETARLAAVTNVTRDVAGIAPKNLIGIPWMLAFALRADGWFLRQEIIWSKPNPTPESVLDRCTKAHEQIFLFSKSPRYHFDAEAIAEPVAPSTISRLSQDVGAQTGSERVPGKTNGPMKAVGRGGKNAFRGQGSNRDGESAPANREGRDMREIGVGDSRNKRSVWTVATQPYSEAHFATYPPALIEPCILAGCPKGGTVLDPFFGAGTTGLVADRLGRDCIGIELNPEYAELAERRLNADAPLFAEVKAA
jgi:DNA modification methylase